MTNKDKQEFFIFKLIIFFLMGSFGGLIGVFIGWLMAFFFGGSVSAERYLQGLQTYRCLGLLSGWEFVYFVAGLSIGMTLGVLCWIKWILKERIIRDVT